METAKDILHIKKEDSQLAAGQRGYLVYPNEHFVPGTLAEHEDWFEIALDTDGLQPVSGLAGGQGQDRYRFLIAAAGLEKLFCEYSFSLDPENLMYDAAMVPKVRLRDRAPAGEKFADSYKALIAALLAPRYGYQDYLQSGGDLYQKDKAISGIAPLESVLDIAGFLKAGLSELENRLKTGSMLVDKAKYRTMRTLLAVFICLSAALAVFGVRYYLVDFQEKELALAIADKFVAQDYIGILSDVEGKDISAFGREERYMAAYAGVATASLNDQQRSSLMRNFTLNTDSLYLDYWIEMGRGGYEAAIDISRRMGDSELEYYGLVIYRDATGADMRISGEEKADRLKRLDDQIAALEKQVSEAGGAGQDE